MKLLSTGGAAVLAACRSQEPSSSTDGMPADSMPADGPTATASPPVSPSAALSDSSSDPVAGGLAYFKDPSPFIQRGSSLEARLENMHDVITPTELFFVRNNSKSLKLDADAWRLSIDGDAVSEPLALSYTDILDMPSTTLTAYLECAGNHRAMFRLLNGRETQDTQWERGAVGNAEWTGVQLGLVLERAGVDISRALSVLLIGLDEESPEKGFRRAMPVEKAMDSHTLLAYSINGETLPADHGFPLRAVVPGWVGSSWIKWIGRIVVSSQPVWTRNNTTSYVLIGDDYPPQGQADGVPLTEQSIKSALALPWPARLPAGRHVLHGYAHSPSGIDRVEWSTDSGATWAKAALHTVQDTPRERYSWVRFEFEWSPNPGDYTVMTRATDTHGRSQPDTVPFNEKGYLFNQPLPHPVKVVL